MKNDLQDRIRVIEESLSKRERCLAETMLRLGPTLKNYSATELAEIASVSSSTVSRFVKRLGYSHYKQALKEVQSVNLAMREPESALSERLNAGDISRHLSLHVSSEIENTQHTFDQLDINLVSTIAHRLADAEKIWVVGFNDDYAMAHYARSLLIRIKSDIRMIPLSGFPVAEEFASISEQDVILVFAERRITREVLKIIASGQQAGAQIVMIGGQNINSLPGTTLLRYSSRGMYMFESATAGVCLVNFICSEVGALLGKPAVERLYYIERLHDAWTNED